jgi:hypothetical protein
LGSEFGGLTGRAGERKNVACGHPGFELANDETAKISCGSSDGDVHGVHPFVWRLISYW